MDSHETVIRAVADLAVARLSPEEQSRVKPRIVYGAGAGTGARGVTFFGKWQNGEPEPVDLVEICAFGEESLVQVAGTTIHELAHVLAGRDAGHGKDWKAACARLGLRCAKAAGMRYTLCALEPQIREVVWRAEFKDGRPANALAPHGVSVVRPSVVRPCTLGYGTRGGRSRGPGSGSRYRRYVCACPVIVRAATDELDATCNVCGSKFERS